jgi:hypothetical protein
MGVTWITEVVANTFASKVWRAARRCTYAVVGYGCVGQARLTEYDLVEDPTTSMRYR